MTAAARGAERRMAVTAAGLVVIGPLSLALMSPALPAVADAFGVGEAAVTPLMTLYLAGFALGQLLCGPLSDRYGRRPVTLGFLALYLLATAAALLAPSVAVLTAARLAQGIGASVALTIARAMVRDRFQGQAAARILSLVGMTVSVAPALAPPVAGLVLAAGSWRWLFAVMGLYALGLLLVVQVRLRETAALTAEPGRGLHVGHILRTYAMLAADRRFLSPALTGAFGIGGIYSFVTITPLVLAGPVGLGPTEVGWLMAGPAACYFLGSIVAGRLLDRHTADGLMIAGASVLLAAGVASAVLLGVAGATMATVMAPVLLWGFGVALLMPGASAGALTPFPRSAGAAAALMGCVQMGTGTLGGLLATHLGDSVTGQAVVPLLFGLCCLAARLAQPRT